METAEAMKQARAITQSIGQVKSMTNREVVLKLSSGATVLLDAAAAKAAMPRIMKQYHVPGDRSADLVVAPASVAVAAKAKRQRARPGR